MVGVGGVPSSKARDRSAAREPGLFFEVGLIADHETDEVPKIG
jgi:hypothetical protein